MKSKERSPKPPKQQSKPNDQSPKLDFVAYKPVEKQQPTSQPDITPSDESPSVEQPAPAEVMPAFISKTNAAKKPQHLEKGFTELISSGKKNPNYRDSLSRSPNLHFEIMMKNYRQNAVNISNLWTATN